MTGSADAEGFSRPDGTGQGDPTRRPSFMPSRPSPLAHAPTEGPGLSPQDGTSPAHPATETGYPPPADEVAWDRTATATGGRWPDGDTAGPGQAGPAGPGRPGYGSAEVRYGPGVPGAAPSGQAPVSAEEVWRTGRLPGPPARRGRWRRRAGTALTAALLVASGVLIYLRLHHAPFAVTGVAITSQVKDGCAVDVTGRISTSGGAGSVSYQWVLTPQVTAPRPLSQSVIAGQSAVYVTFSDQGTGHGQAAQQVTLQVLSPGQGRASTHVVISC